MTLLRWYGRPFLTIRNGYPPKSLIAANPKKY